MNEQDDKKNKAREYMERRQVERRQTERQPLHDIEQVRRELGWDLVDRRSTDRRKP